MPTISFRDENFSELIERLVNRAAIPSRIEDEVAVMIDQVARFGDEAVIKYAEQFDGILLEPGNFQVSPAEIEQAAASLAPELRQAIELAHTQIADFARPRRPCSWSDSPRPGVVLGERFNPLDRVGAYIPGGTAPLISSVLHTVTLARVAGVGQITASTPPGPAGQVHPALLYAAAQARADTVLRLGGVYAIAALALGTETIEKVEKIVGPGNAYVTAAKRQLYGKVALDMVAGPSEIMIIGDHTSDPRLVAADLLSQLEHGSGHEQAVLATDSDSLLNTVQDQLQRQTEQLDRTGYIRECMVNGLFFILLQNLEAAAELAGKYAPEHLEIMCRQPEAIADRVTAAGAIFIGPWTPEPAGDFVAGPSHVLPTNGAARFFNGLTVDNFFRRTSLVKYDKQALHRELPAITALAEAEGLTAHARSATIRFD